MKIFKIKVQNYNNKILSEISHKQKQALATAELSHVH